MKEYKKSFIEAETTENIEISGVYRMMLRAPEVAANCVPGQFVSLYTGKENMILPRPISICFADADTLCLVYQAVGAGTELFSKMKVGERIKLLGPLGNGYQISERRSHTIIGGGIGIPPLLFLARTLRRDYPYCRISAYLGFRSGSFLIQEFEALGVEMHVATDDGSVGFKGNAVEMLRAAVNRHEVIYSCGPTPMLRAVEEYARESGIDYQLSLEERMACGLGACVGCVVKIETESGVVQKKVCYDGPVFCFGGKERAFIWNIIE